MSLNQFSSTKNQRLTFLFSKSIKTSISPPNFPFFFLINKQTAQDRLPSAHPNTTASKLTPIKSKTKHTKETKMCTLRVYHCDRCGRAVRGDPIIPCDQQWDLNHVRNVRPVQCRYTGPCGGPGCPINTNGSGSGSRTRRWGDVKWKGEGMGKREWWEEYGR